MNRSLAISIALVASLAAPSAFAQSDAPEGVRLYGFFRLDAIYDDSQMNDVQGPEWVELESAADDDDGELSIHPRLTRVGLDVSPRRIGEFSASGKIEVDFKNGGGEARQLLRLREAYFELKVDLFELLVGQAWDLISPLSPTVNTDTVMWNTGNLADRRPQVRASAVLPVARGALRLAVMAGQTGAVDRQDADADGRLDGLESGVPTVQGLGEFTRAGVRLGLWGHGGFEAVSTPIADVDGFPSWAVGVHAHVPFQEIMFVRGEFHRGVNLDDVRGGIGQAVNATTGEGIASTGGWVELGAQIRKPYLITLGVFVENPDDADLEDGQRELNWAYAITQRIRPLERLTIGLDYIFWKTDYKAIGSGTANRLDAFIALEF